MNKNSGIEIHARLLYLLIRKKWHMRDVKLFFLLYSLHFGIHYSFIKRIEMITYTIIPAKEYVMGQCYMRNYYFHVLYYMQNLLNKHVNCTDKLTCIHTFMHITTIKHIQIHILYRQMFSKFNYTTLPLY